MADPYNAIVTSIDDASAGEGPLTGLRMTVKANIAVAGQPLTAASLILDGYRAPSHARGDATCVARVRAAGARIVGLTNMDEFGMGGSSERSSYGPVKNPWDTTRTAGGSSGGGAAAVAAGLCDAALGTDTGGSVRQPAAFCGVVGVKPSYGRVSRRGVVAFASSLDQVGVLAKDIDTAADVLTAICGADDGDMTTVQNPLPDLLPNARAASSSPSSGLKVGVLSGALLEGTEPAILAALAMSAQQFRDAGAVVTEISLAHVEQAVAAYYVIAMAEASSNLSRYDGVRYGPRAPHKDLGELYEGTRALFGDEVKRRVVLGTFVLSHGYYDAYLLQAQKVRALIIQSLKRAFDDVDVILLPTTPTQPFALGQKLASPLAMYLGDLFTLPASLAGLPAVSVPVAVHDGLPIGMQLIGRPYDEGTLLAAARVIARTFTPETP